MIKKEQDAAFLAFLANIVLFILKIIAAMASGSLAVLSSAFDSLNDIITYFIGYYSIKQSARGPDRDHPFGHRRMEPLAAIMVAIFTGILAFEILRSVFFTIIDGERVVDITTFTFGVLVFTIAVKLVMYFFLERKAERTMSTALEALAADSRNDVLSNLIAVMGIAGAYLGLIYFDEAAAVLIAVYIAYSGYRIARKNIDYIVGRRPDRKTIDNIREHANVPGVKRVKNIRAHYVGDRVHAEIEIALDKNLKGPESHDIAVRVQKSVEHIKIIGRAFVHIDYE